MNEGERSTADEGSEAGDRSAAAAMRDPRHGEYEPFCDRLVQWRPAQRSRHRGAADHLLGDAPAAAGR